MSKRLWGTTDIAREVEVAVSSVYNWRDTGRLEGVEFPKPAAHSGNGPLWDPDDVRDFVRAVQKKRRRRGLP